MDVVALSKIVAEKRASASWRSFSTASGGF